MLVSISGIVVAGVAMMCFQSAVVVTESGRSSTGLHLENKITSMTMISNIAIVSDYDCH